MASVTRTLAEFVLNLTYEKIPTDVIDFTKTCILDLFGSAFAAIGSPLSSAAGVFSEEAFGRGGVTRWDTGRRVSLLAATWVNSTLASAMDLDDGNRLAIGHPGAAVIPATLAAAEQERAQGRRIVEAIIAGYEAAIRLSHSRDPQKIENVATGGWSGFGAAIGAAKLFSDTVERIEDTLGLASMYGPRLPGSFPGGRRMVKEGIPWSAVAGVSSAYLARSSFTGPESAIDHLPLYNAQKILDGLGKDFFILKTYFKRYPCCRWIHPIIEGCLALIDEGGFQVSQIQEIRIQTFSRAFGLPNRVKPQTLEEAQFSIPFCTALAMVREEKEKGFFRILREDLSDSNVVSLSGRVSLEHHPGFDGLFPEKIFSKVTVETSMGRFERIVSSAKGDSDNPFSVRELQEKYLTYATPVIGDKTAMRFMEHIRALEDISIEDMMKLLTFKTHSIKR
jgi:2-methylcitrate dehydratase PrpD